MQKKSIQCNEWRRRFEQIYGKTVVCRVGTGLPQYNVDKEKASIADIAIYINEKYEIALIWNLSDRRKNSREIGAFSVSIPWEEMLPENQGMRALYKKMGTDITAPYEKVLILSLDVLETTIYELRERIMVNPEDDEFPQDISSMDYIKYDILPEGCRERVSTSSWKRKWNFRRDVLKAYGYQCAICRCKAEKILQAAHIKAVADGGKDETSNGICLCANHHGMFDNQLIKIAFDSYTLPYVDKTVSEMPWYAVFMEKYKGKIMQPKEIEQR